uniref:ORF34 n=1 Tax=Nitrosopumilaceae spindle-shaped virus TaxID=3065433 RepID=A0AAT9J733_9VIRU
MTPEQLETQHNNITMYVENKNNEMFTTITLQKLRRGIKRRLGVISKYPKCYKYINIDTILLKRLQGRIDIPDGAYFQNKNKLDFRHSKFDEQVDFVLNNKEFEKSLLRKSTPTKYDLKPSIISLADVEMHKDVLQSHVRYIEKVKKICTELDFKNDLVDVIDRRIILLENHLEKWNDVKTFDSYSDETDLQLLDRTQQIYKENKKFKDLIETAFSYGIFNHPRPKTFMSLMNILSQTDKERLDKRFDNNTEPITNIIQSMVVVEKHAKQGGSKDQLARAMYNLYNTHLFDELELNYIISQYISDEANFNIRRLATYQLFKNPPEWLQKLIDGDNKIMTSQIRIKEESNVKKKILLEKLKIKKQFLKLSYGKRYNMNDELQTQVFEKSFNGYIDGTYTRLDKDINLNELDKLLNMVRMF